LYLKAAYPKNAKSMYSSITKNKTCELPTDIQSTRPRMDVSPDDFSEDLNLWRYKSCEEPRMSNPNSNPSNPLDYKTKILETPVFPYEKFPGFGREGEKRLLLEPGQKGILGNPQWPVSDQGELEVS
jgi:hypothetical protein